jgi:DNA-binding response OmpR family regulator
LLTTTKILLKAAKMYLKRHVAQVDIEKNPEAIPALMSNEEYDVILLDMNFTKDVSSGSEGYYWLEKILSIDPSAVVVLDYSIWRCADGR